jgi:hypothetical protein
MEGGSDWSTDDRLNGVKAWMVSRKASTSENSNFLYPSSIVHHHSDARKLSSKPSPDCTTRHAGIPFLTSVRHLASLGQRYTDIR